MKEKFAIKFMLAGLCLAAAAALLTGARPAPASAGEPALVVYHTNDVHGYAFHEKDQDGQPRHWGYDYLKALVDGDEARNKLLIDAGDVLQGQPFATARKGELAARVLSMMNYDAFAAGNHDFDYGWRRLTELRDAYRLNFLAANVKKREGGERLLAPYILRDLAELKVGVFGLSTPATTTSTDPRHVAGLDFGSPREIIEIARETVKYMKEIEKTDIIIAVTHIGSEAYCDPSSRTLAREAPGIDLIIDGHSHSELKDGLRVGKTLIASAGSHLTNVGRVEARRASDGWSLSAKLMPAAETSNIRPNPEMSAAMNALKTELEREMSAVVARSPIDLIGDRTAVRYRSTNLGRLTAAALVKGTGAEAALVNSGSIRDSLPRGDITKGMLLTVMPYDNYVFVVEMTGEDLLAALNHGLSQPGAGAFPQFYGLTVTARKTTRKLADGTPVDSFVAEEVKIGGQALVGKAKYKIAITDFLYAGGDDYTWFAKRPYSEFGTLEDLFRTFLTDSDAQTIKAVDAAEVLTISP
ncbi:MAG: bifunctional metallophosphatase/5'-nucleotidase [Candidatus Adiutrix sp.]|jgi:2',3'-cyclic-nucleotide 2'-phosphodiesterase (5'-nucleotidase family)|nr:bifunctional metallophosphatase/5'-nucleotidase [Candidatus Adiutrix sp.]